MSHAANWLGLQIGAANKPQADSSSLSGEGLKYSSEETE